MLGTYNWIILGSTYYEKSDHSEVELLLEKHWKYHLKEGKIKLSPET